jgi:hypothetical protein
MDVHEHPHEHFDLTFVLLLTIVYLETLTVIDLIQFGQINVASFDLFIWTVFIISSFPTTVHLISYRRFFYYSPYDFKKQLLEKHLGFLQRREK